MTTEQLSDTDIDALRAEIDRLDAEILAAVRRRTEVSQEIGKVRTASRGGHAAVPVEPIVIQSIRRAP